MNTEIAEDDQFLIRTNFLAICNNINTVTLIPSLHKHKVLSDEDLTTLKGLDSTKSTEYLIFKVLIKHGNNNTLDVFRKVLTELQQNRVLELLPPGNTAADEDETDGNIRDQCNHSGQHQDKHHLELSNGVEDNTNTCTQEQQEVISDNNRGSDEEEVLRAAGPRSSFIQTFRNFSFKKKKKKQKDPESHEENNVKIQPDVQPAVPPQTQKEKVKVNTKFSDNTNTKEQQEVTSDNIDGSDEEVVRAAGGPLASLKKRLSLKKKKKPKENLIQDQESPEINPKIQPSVEPAVQPWTQKEKVKVITKFSDAFLHYECKDQGSEHGRGLCVIFALFTSDLQGYLYDVQTARNFFEEELGYEVWYGNRFENLTQDQLFEKIGSIRNYLEDKQYFDRLVMVILTHGQPDGLLTCADRDGNLAEQHQVVYENLRTGQKEIYYKTTKTKVEEIVDCFKHDVLHSLKDMPKLFLIQACRGQEIVKAANKTNTNTGDTVDGPIDSSQLPFNPVSPVDGDIMICQSTTENHSSLVNPFEGSWFIRHTIEVFRNHYRVEHVADMMTVVNLAVAELRGNINNKDGTRTYALQIPCIHSTFRRRFYLCNRSTRTHTGYGQGYEGNSGVILPSHRVHQYVFYPKVQSESEQQVPYNQTQPNHHGQMVGGHINRQQPLCPDHSGRQNPTRYGGGTSGFANQNR